MTASDKRLAAIHTVLITFLDEDGEWSHVYSRDEIAQAIVPLTALGKTTRWFNAIHLWESMVLDSMPINTRWALLQGSILAGHAAF
jgi:hypothetical protein